MNDASLTLPRLKTSENDAALALNFDVELLPLASGLPVLENVAALGQSGFSCAPHWVRHWAAEVNPNIVVITASRNGQIVAALALEIIQKSGLKIAQFVGGSHANANFPAITSQLAENEAVVLLDQIKLGLAGEPWFVDAIMLERQLETLGGIANPLLSGGSSISPNVSLHLSVDQSFDAVLELRSAKRKRKRNRSQQRKFEAAGGYQIVNPASKDASANLLDQYFAMKAQQLSGKGVANVFGDAKEQAFFKALFSDEGTHHDHNFYLSSLDVGGKTRAIYGSSLHSSRQMVHFTAFSNDELTAASPGDFLNFALVEAACKASTRTYDLGVGDEGYKRSWCDVETWHHDVVIGLSLRGKIAKFQFDAARSAKRWVKNNEKIWEFAKRIRKLKSGKGAETRPATEDGSEL
jgi:CelD/BcsL family acetyltransferase involved in cellulose biosynthesis